MPTIGALAGYFYSQGQEPVYEARATLLVQYRGGGFALGTSDFRRSEELASTYRRLVTTRPFLERVRLDGLPSGDTAALQDMVTASTGTNPPVVDIKVRHNNPVVAAAVAQGIAEQFIDYAIEQKLAEIARLQSAAIAQGITNFGDLVTAQFTALDNISLLEPVDPPGTPVVPRTRQNIVLGTILGLFLAAGGALLLESLRDTVRFPDQIDRRFGVPSLGSIFRWSSDDIGNEELVLWAAPSSGFAESLRQVRANLEFATANRPGGLIMVGSPGPGEGKSTILSNLAIAVAQAGKRVVVIDGDLRRPTLHRLFGLDHGERGLSNLLVDPSTTLEDVIVQTDINGVELIPSGPTPPNPAELLGSPRMASALSQLKTTYDMVFLDSPPVLLVADGSIMASQSDGVIVVVDGLGTKSASLKAALDTLRNTQVHIVGVVVNRLKRARFGYGYRYPYHYYYSSYYRYYSDGDEVAANGTGRFYKRLTRRAMSALSRFRGD